jgi:hypothetical protein
VSELPTAAQMLANADEHLSRAMSELDQAVAWANSDWQPVGSVLTGEQAEHRTAIYRAVRRAKAEIMEALR